MADPLFTGPQTVEDALGDAQQIFRLLVSAVRDYAIFALDPNGKILTWNIGAERLKGYSAQEIIGQHFSKFYTPEDLARHHPEEELRLAIKNGVYEEEGWRVKKDGSRFWANVLITALRDPSGKLRGFAKVTRDLTERIKAEEARIAENAYHETKALLNASPSFFGFVQPHTGVLIDCNDLALHIIQKSREEIIGRVFWECEWWSTLPESAERVRVAVLEAAKGGTSEFDTLYWAAVAGRPEGQARWVNFRAVPYRNKFGSVERVAVSGIEITDRKIAEDKMREAIKTRDEFLSIASHELKTPLTGMKIQTQLFARAMAKDPKSVLVPAKVSDLLGQMDQGLNRLVRLVDDMLDISKIQNNKLSFQFEPTDIGSLIFETLERFRPELSHAGIELKMDLAPNLEGNIDRFRIEQVLTNLITNAIRYAPHAPLDVTLTRDGSWAVISFQDHGPGIEPKDQARLFKRFERLVSANEISGMGLGLFICKKIMESHGGFIQVHSQKGKGARFVVNIPLSEVGKK